jgi:TrmH family RNA methyltransferase
LKSWLDRVEVVLARPEGALNVGAVCRAMKSMGLSRLVLVAPRDFDDEEVLLMAIHARDVYENSRRFDSLEEALAGTALSAGITRRRGAKRKPFSIVPEELAIKSSELADGTTSLVFGNERAGLSDEELNHCNIACHIPTSPDFPSLNLSHAVQIITSVFYRVSLEGKTGSYAPVTREEVDHLVGVIHDSLDAMNYFKAADRFQTDRFFRDILTRAAMSTREARHLEKVFRKLQYLREPGDSES